MSENNTNDQVNNGYEGIPTPSEAAEAEVVKFRQPEGYPDSTMTVEEYLLGLLDESHTDEEARPAVKELVVEARGSLELAKLLIERERLIEKRNRPHPSISSTGLQNIADELKKLNHQIIELKNELGSQANP